MEPYDCVVIDIKGEYAYLKRADIQECEPIMIALLLLPEGSDIGTELHYENLEYSIID